MSREKQIEDMARIIDDNHGFIVSSVETAEALYTAGYRKASDVAREIFEEIEKNMVSIDFNRFRAMGRRTFAKLKKKYTEGEE